MGKDLEEPESRSEASHAQTLTMPGLEERSEFILGERKQHFLLLWVSLSVSAALCPSLLSFLLCLLFALSQSS